VYFVSPLFTLVFEANEQIGRKPHKIIRKFDFYSNKKLKIFSCLLHLNYNISCNVIPYEFALELSMFRQPRNDLESVN